MLTSGGDAPGMNAAVRGAVRAARGAGAEVLGVLEGYEGLVEGRFCTFDDVDLDEAMREGGTFLGTARSEAFRTTAGRRQAVGALAARGITGLVVIGGDGSLTGAHVLAEEWAAHAQALGVDRTPPEILGIAASIDNDLAGSDRTLGCDSALQRIVEAIDALESTARSHRRAFVVEVMGRRCGWLALTAAICTGADHVLIPESANQNWETGLCTALEQGRKRGRRQSIVLLAEGATDGAGVRIQAEQVAAVIRSQLQLDTRITVLGHVQRGGAPSAIDRMHGTAAGERVATWHPSTPEVLISRGDRLIPQSLATTLAGEAKLPIDELDGLHRGLAGPARSGTHGRVLIANVGAPAPGMNAAIRGVARGLHLRGFTPVVAYGGLGSLLDTPPAPLSWNDVEGWQSRSGTSLGSARWKRLDPFKLKVALDRHGITHSVLIGGFGALHAAEVIGVPCAVLPATISNNVPGTDVSIGTDTALNRIADAVDGLRQSALGSTRRVFFIEVMGARCGYLARAAGILCGADKVYAPEKPPDLGSLEADIERMCAHITNGPGVGLVIVSDGLQAPWDTATLAKLYESAGQGSFDTRVCVLGHLQQGSRPSAADRLLAARLAHAAADHLTHAVIAPGSEVFGVRDGAVIRTSVAAVLAKSDSVNRRPSALRP